MADSISPQELHSTTHSKPTCKNRSCSRFLCKSLSFLIFLVAISFFPSQAPNFLNETRFTKLWEPVHLLFIGVAVCYGLFSRKRTNFDGDLETQSTVLDDSHSSYVSRIFHVSSIFEDGFDNPCVSDDKNVYQSWNFRYHRGDLSMVNVAYGGSVVSEQRNSESLYSENGLQASLEAWNSQSFRGESNAVVSQPNCLIDEYGENEDLIGLKSLGLPVRRLNSRVRNAGSPSLSNETGSNSSSGALSKSNSSEKSEEDAKFGDMDPINLEERFNDTVLWRSTSARMEMREKVGSVANGSSHLRPLSVDETQFDSLNSHSLRSTASFSTESGLATYLPTGLSPSHHIVSELPNSETEELGKNKINRASYPPASKSSQTTMNGGSQPNAFHLRRYSSGSLFQKDLQKNLESEFKNLSENLRDDSLSSTEKGQASLKLDKKPTVGKSVRTIRPSGYTSEAKNAPDATKYHAEVSIGENLDESKEAKAGKSETRRPDKMPVGGNEKSPDDIPRLQKPSFEKYDKERNEASGNVAVVSESGVDSSDEDSLIGIGCHAGDDTNEVDKKAAEFIAKFREQIRLQKVESMERSRRFRRTRNKWLGDAAQ